MQLDYKDIIIKHYALSMSGSEIARQTGFSKSGVNDFLRAFKKCEDLNYPLPAGITNYGIALKEDLIMANLILTCTKSCHRTTSRLALFENLVSL